MNLILAREDFRPSQLRRESFQEPEIEEKKVIIVMQTNSIRVVVVIFHNDLIRI